MDIAFEAMMFAREVHKDQKRKYTGDPYVSHLAEVAGIASTCFTSDNYIHPAIIIAISMLHDSMEDQGVTYIALVNKFGVFVADGVRWLSDLEQGNRVTRKALSCERLSKAPSWIQTIKCADLISNSSSIVLHDPKFAVTYLKEKLALLEVMTKADPRLWDIAMKQVEEGLKR